MTAINWSIDPTTLHPLILFSAKRNFYVWDAVKQYRRSALVGHGGVCSIVLSEASKFLTIFKRQEITSIAVHRHTPHIVATTSRDRTVRIWQLDKLPPLSATSVPFPDRAIREHSRGPGVCRMVLHGGRGACHEGAVLHTV